MLLITASESTGNLIGVVVVVAILVGLLIAAFLNPRFRSEFKNWRPGNPENLKVPQVSPLSNQLKPVSESEMDYIMASTGSYLATYGYLPQSQSAGFYFYATKRRADVFLLIVLFLLCIIPGIIYLIVAGQGESIISIQVVPDSAGPTLVINAPSAMSQGILTHVDACTLPAQT